MARPESRPEVLHGKLDDEGRAAAQVAWLEAGIAAGYCSDIVCATHDGMPLTDEEQADFGMWEDGCVPAVRLWEIDVVL